MYPIKALRGIRLERAQLGPRGIRHDRRFMLYRVHEDGSLRKIQLSSYPQCGLFEQALVGGEIHVRYRRPACPVAPAHPLQDETLAVPLEPDAAGLDRISVDLHGSPATAYRMGGAHDAWFSACFGFDTALVFIGDGRRKVLGTLAPASQEPPPPQGWLSLAASYMDVWGAVPRKEPPPPPQEEPWLAFADCAPFLVTSEASLRNVSARLADGADVPMYKFRPNIVVDGEEEWAEDLWAELQLPDGSRLLLTANCGRCTSLNVDYDTGRLAAGELGTVLKRLMADRRVDRGNRWSPVFGRYAFLDAPAREVEVSTGDDVAVTQRLAETTVWDWPGL